MPRLACLLLFSLCATACDDAPAPTDAGTGDAAAPDAATDAGPALRAECENVNATHCLLPWPSSRFLVEDAETATGLRLALDPATMPVNDRMDPVDTSQFERFDGFSPMTSIMTSFAGPVEAALLHGEEEIAETLSPDSSTVLVDAETGELVAHFAELDLWPQSEPDRAPLYLRPAARLAEGRRYVVAIQGLAFEGGAPVEPSAYFRALRDDTPLPEADARRAHFEEIFGVLDGAGVARGGLIEAWDFVTASGETLWSDLVAMRDDAVGRGDPDFGRVGAEGLGCEVTLVEDRDAGDELPEAIWRRVYGQLTVPLYLQGTEPADADESRLRRAADGRPLAEGTAQVAFLVQIPTSVRDRVQAGGAPAQLEIYGHGLFGARTEINAGWHVQHQSRLEVVSAGVDWWGMAADDRARVIRTLQDFSDFDATPERLTQSVINVLVLTRSLRGSCGELPELQVPVGDTTLPAFDARDAYYYGNSQGGIMGGVVAGVATELERFVLGVGGVSYPIMIKRSVNWTSFSAIMELAYTDPLERDLLMVMSAPLWDLAEPSTYAPHLVRDPLPGTPPKRVLMQIGVGDAQVPNVSAEIQARTAGIPVLTPAPWTPYGLETTPGPVDSALVLYEIPPVERSQPGTRSPGDDNAAHEGVRRSEAAVDQIGAFTAADGQVVQTCDGICDPG